MYLYEFFLYNLRVYGLKYVEQLPKRWTLSEMLEMFPLENNSDIKDLTQMPEKPDNF